MVDNHNHLPEMVPSLRCNLEIFFLPPEKEKESITPELKRKHIELAIVAMESTKQVSKNGQSQNPVLFMGSSEYAGTVQSTSHPPVSPLQPIPADANRFPAFPSKFW